MGERKKPSVSFERSEVLQRRVMPKRTPPLVCLACSTPIAEGQGFTMICLGPGADPLEREKCQRGEPYSAAIAVVHWACVTGDATPEADKCSLCEAPLGDHGGCVTPSCDLFAGPYSPPEGRSPEVAKAVEDGKRILGELEERELTRAKARQVCGEDSKD